jgi:hypothetical protein
MLRRGFTALRSEPEDLRQVVAGCLEELLRSEPFRNSRQSEKLLRYLVQHSLEGHDDQLREKQVGTAVFLRDQDYDTSTDSIVRVRVNEIRKRLAQYYQCAEPQPPVRLDIPSGSYRVEFVRHDAPPVPSPQPPAVKRPVRRLVYAALILAAVAAAAAVAWLRPAPAPLTRFWEPVLASASPVILCSGHPVLYRFTTQFRNRMSFGVTDQFEYQTTTPKLPHGTMLSSDDLVPVQNQYIGLGSAYAIARISSWLARNHKESEVRFGNDISFTDLKRSPAVLIGAFQNRWTLQLMSNQRFVFETREGRPCVRDRQTNRVWSLPNLKDDGTTNEDYIIITRVLHSETGQFVVVAAGITQYGCQTAGDVLTSSDFLAEALRQLGRDWPRRSFQLLLHVPIIGETPGAPTLVAAQVS